MRHAEDSRNVQEGDETEFGAALARAQAAVAELGDQYLSWVSADLARLEDCLNGIDDPPAPAQLRAAFEVAHVIKGQGGTFGYPLVTGIANLLCRYLERARQGAPYRAEIAGACQKSLQRIVADRITGDGGELGAAVMAMLREKTGMD